MTPSYRLPLAAAGTSQPGAPATTRASVSLGAEQVLTLHVPLLRSDDSTEQN